MPHDMILPEVPFQRYQFIFILLIAGDVSDNDLVFDVAVQTAEIYLIQIHDAHIVPALQLIVHRNTFHTVQPPIVSGVVICGFGLQYCCFAVWQFNEIVHIREHEGMHGMVEHFLDLIHTISRFFREVFRVS